MVNSTQRLMGECWTAEHHRYLSIPSMKFNWRKVVGRVGLLFAGFTFAFLITEIALRVLPVPNRFTLERLLEQQWEPDPELLLRLKPNLDMKIYGHPEFTYSIRTNSDGLRDEPFQGEIPIAAIGDSFTFGFGVEEYESWPSQLEDLGNMRVANLGWAGWNSLVYPVVIRRHAMPLHSRVWLWAFFINDLPESAGAEEFLLAGESDYLVWRDKEGYTPSSLRFPLTLRTIQFVAALLNPELFLLPNSGDFVFDHPDLRMQVGHYPWQVSDPTDPAVQRGWELTETALQEAAGLAQANDAALVVIFIPSREHVYWPYIKDLLPDVRIEQLDESESRLAEICTALGIPYLNLLPEFRSHAMDRQMLYYPSDGHWNPAGHELAAQIIFGFLVEQVLIDP